MSEVEPEQEGVSDHVLSIDGYLGSIFFKGPKRQPDVVIKIVQSSAQQEKKQKWKVEEGKLLKRQVRIYFCFLCLCCPSLRVNHRRQYIYMQKK